MLRRHVDNLIRDFLETQKGRVHDGITTQRAIKERYMIGVPLQSCLEVLERMAGWNGAERMPNGHDGQAQYLIK